MKSIMKQITDYIQLDFRMVVELFFIYFFQESWVKWAILRGKASLKIQIEVTLVNLLIRSDEGGD